MAVRLFRRLLQSTEAVFFRSLNRTLWAIFAVWCAKGVEFNLYHMQRQLHDTNQLQPNDSAAH